MTKKKYYVCAEFSKDCINKRFYQYCNNKLEASKLITALKKQNKRIIAWIDFVWNSEYGKISETALHGRMFTQTNSLLNEL